MRVGLDALARFDAFVFGIKGSLTPTANHGQDNIFATILPDPSRAQQTARTPALKGKTLPTPLLAFEVYVTIADRKIECLWKSFDGKFSSARGFPIFVEPSVFH
jgi:hypothetical protein